MGFNENIVDEIKSRCNIVDVIGRHVVLKKTGNNHKGLCPFHNEKTPSFVVSEDKQIFTCFGCGATGDVIEFTRRYNNLDFHEAIERLASEYGVELSNSSFATEVKKTILYDINREAAAYFYRSFTQSANAGYEYMQKRGLEPATLRRFGIGYADSSWNGLYDHFVSKGTDVEQLLSLGLISNSKGKNYDKFRDRVIFPIINTRGKVIGFGGRAIADGTPKYLNSPESSVFQKKNNLYGLNLTRQDINREDLAILVEGYMDAVSLYQHGVRNVAASLGTALTENQAAMLKRYTGNVVLAYDSDEAGQVATLRGMDILHAAGCSVKVLTLTEGKDPDDFIKKNGRDGFLELVKQAMPFADYKIHLLNKKYDLKTTDGSLAFLKAAAAILRTLGPMEADIYIKKIAGQAKISEGAIRQEVYGEGSKAFDRPTLVSRSKKQYDQNNQDDMRTRIQHNLIKLMLVKSSYVPKVRPYEYVFLDSTPYRIYEIILSLYREDSEIDVRKIADSIEEQEINVLNHILDNVQFADRDSQVFEDCVLQIRRMATQKREEEIIQLLSILNDENDSDNILALTKELMELQQVNSGGEMRNEL
jgi:DNA primase